MKKEEILEKSRQENKKKDVYAIEVEKDGCKYAAISMVILTVLYYIYEIFADKGQNYALYSIIAIYCCVFFGYRGIKLEKNRSLYIFTSIIWLFITIITISQYFRG